VCGLKTIVTTSYACDVCGHQYASADSAIKCEQIPILYDLGVKVGDSVRITYGEDAGNLAVVESIHVASLGHVPKWLVHSRYLIAKCVESYGSRVLYYQQYEVMK
jgi:hypothetical protein